MNTFPELWDNVLQSTSVGTIGVIGIWFYMATIVVAALYRIKKGDHMRH